MRCRRTYSIVRYSWPQEPRASGSQRVELWHSGLCDNLGGGLCACPTFSILSHLGISGISLEELLLYHLEVYGRRYPSSLCHQYNRTVKSTASTVFSSRLPVRFTGLSGARVQASGGVCRESHPQHLTIPRDNNIQNTTTHQIMTWASATPPETLYEVLFLCIRYSEDTAMNPTLRNAAASFAAIDFPTSHKTLPIQDEYNSRIGRRIATPLLLLHN